MRGVEPIAIIGIGCRFPGGVRSADDLWNLLANGVDAITEVPKERWHLPAVYHPDAAKPGRMNSRWGGFLDNLDRFDADFFGISPREAERADPQQRLLLEVAYHAVEDAGLTLDDLAGRRASVHVGVSNWDYSFLQLDASDRASIGAHTGLGAMLCVAANRLSYFFNLVGPSLAIDSACSSSLVAVHLGCQSIWSGESDLAFVAGVNVLLRPETTIACTKASMLSPDGRCRSFDSRANGFVRAEGAAVVILKPLVRAVTDRDQIYALIRATAVNQDGRTEGITVPSRAAQAANLRNALQLADIAPASVQYVEAHGPGTAVGDPIEAAAVGDVYGKAQRTGQRCVIGSIKSNLGHLEPAAGIAGLIKAALCLQHRQIPANLHFETPNPQIPFDDLRLRVAQRLQPWPDSDGQPPRAGVNSFGFGGTNAHAILEARTEPARTARTSDAPVNDRAWLLPLSARSAPALSDLARSYRRALTDGALKHAALPDICYSAATRRSHHDVRLTLVAHDKTELTDQLEAFLRGEDRANTSTNLVSSMPSKPVFVCSGMGQQWWAMGRELLGQEPVYRQALEEVSDHFGRLAGWSLLDHMIADEKESRIQQTHIALPAIFAMQIALAALWRSWGVEPAAVFGHSAGEVAASAIAGALSLDDAVRVVYHRSRLLRRTVGQGAMLAAGISREEAARFVEGHPDAISIAAINAPGSVTLSGDAGVLAEIDKALIERGVLSRTLKVEAPFHSPRMEQIQSELVECLRGIRPRPASTPFFSIVTGTAMVGTEVDGAHWYRNTRQPVLFQDTMAQLIDAGHRVFLEIGAHPILRHDIAACLNEKSVQGMCLPSVRRGERELAAMLGSLGRLQTIGAEIDWRRLFPPDTTAIKLPVYPFQAESHWRESDRTRRMRLGQSIHPLLGNRLEASQPLWSVKLDAAHLDYLEDHRVGGAIVFPAAGFIEMALAAAREIHGPGPCVLEDVEFERFLLLDENAAGSVQLAFDAASSGFEISARADSPGSTWESHARGYLRHVDLPPTAAGLELAQIRRRCADPVDPEEFYRQYADMGLNYGPNFRGITKIWRNGSEVLAEIQPPIGIEQTADYRMHPTVLDAGCQIILPASPIDISRGPKTEAYLPVKIERVRFHRTPSARVFSHLQLREFGPTQLTADIRIFDEDGARVLDVQGLVCRPIKQRAPDVNSTLYEYQWKLSSRRATPGPRDSQHLPSLETLAPILLKEGQALWQRFDRARYHTEFHSHSRTLAAAYIVRALRALGWRPAQLASMSIESLADQLGVATHYRRWLRQMLGELTAHEMESTEDPDRPWAALWNEFPESQSEMLLLRRCGEHLPAVLRGEIDPLNVIFPDGSLTNTEHLYQDSPTYRLNNMLLRRAVVEIVGRLPRGKGLRILEVGGGTGGMTGALLPVLPRHRTEYVFTDLSARFLSHAEHKFGQYPFVQYRTLDIERDPLAQGFDAHSFDLIVASDVLHATKDLRVTLDGIKQLLGSRGLLALLEVTNAWLANTLTFGLLKGWWLFDDDIRRDGPCISQEQWKRVLSEAGFTGTLCVADGPQTDRALHSVIVAGGPHVFASPHLPQASRVKVWLIFADAGTAGRPSVGGSLSLALRERGDRVIEVIEGTEFQQSGAACTIRAGNVEDLRRLLDSVRREAPQLAGIVHLWSLDTPPTDAITIEALRSSAPLGAVGVLQLLQTLPSDGGLVVDGLSLITHAASAIGNGAGVLQVAQSPLWGFARVAAAEYQRLSFRMVDMVTCSEEEIASLAEELTAGEQADDEIALYGELRYVHRLLPVTTATVQALGEEMEPAAQRFRIDLPRPAVLDALRPRPAERTTPKPNEVEIEVAATGLNVKDLMLAMGMLPSETRRDNTPDAALGFECAGRVLAVGAEVSEFVVGDEVMASVPNCLASHAVADKRLVARKPRHVTLEQAATIPVAFCTALYSLETLGKLQRGERVLIHSAADEVGLAAVQLALHKGAVVFATAGSSDKRELLAALGVPHVMDSRTLAFADQVLELTDGEGVDLVLNSLAGEAVDKSLSLLRPWGRFVEIGKADIEKNRRIGMRPLANNVSLFVVDMQRAFAQRPELAQSLLREVLSRFDTNGLRPIAHRVFPAARVSDAFRSMAEGKHIGKLIISMQDTEGLQLEHPLRPMAIDPGGSYLIAGGLGGLGLAVAERLVRHGARRLVLVGRTGPSPSGQAAVRSLRQAGAHVEIVEGDIADRQQTENMIAATQRDLGPLRGVMHAAMVLDDAPIERLSEERMWTAMAPKMLGAWNLHSLTADCRLDFFVMFSSFASITGNRGQANYAAGNAFLDALAYHRRACGLPALTVNWGMVSGAGHVAQRPEIARRLERLGFIGIPLADALDTLDELMSSDAVQIGVGQLDWTRYIQSTLGRVPPRFADLAAETSAEGEGSSTGVGPRSILEADEATLPALCETCVRDHMARAMGASTARIDTQKSLLSLGLDSLIAVDVRNRINVDLGINIPLEKFMEDTSIQSLAAYVAKRLLAGDGNRRSKPDVGPAGSETGATTRTSGNGGAPLRDAVAQIVVDRRDLPSTEAVRTPDADAEMSVSSETVVELGERLDELSSQIDVCRATTMSPAQLREAAVMLAQAFHDHPVFASAYPQIGRRRKASEALFAAFLKDGLRYGIVDLAYNGGIVGVLIAYPPGSYPMSFRRKLRIAGDYVRIAAISPSALLKLLRVERTLVQMHPKQPHYYGFFLGAAPGQLKFAGPILGRRLVDLAADNDLPVYMEAQERGTVEVYAQFGRCQVLKEGVELYPGGPLTWTLWHEPPARRTKNSGVAG